MTPECFDESVVLLDAIYTFYLDARAPNLKLSAEHFMCIHLLVFINFKNFE